MPARSQRDPADPKGWLVNANAKDCAKPAPSDPVRIRAPVWRARRTAGDARALSFRVHRSI